MPLHFALAFVWREKIGHAMGGEYRTSLDAGDTLRKRSFRLEKEELNVKVSTRSLCSVVNWPSAPPRHILFLGATRLPTVINVAGIPAGIAALFTQMECTKHPDVNDRLRALTKAVATFDVGLRTLFSADTERDMMPVTPYADYEAEKSKGSKLSSSSDQLERGVSSTDQLERRVSTPSQPTSGTKRITPAGGSMLPTTSCWTQSCYRESSRRRRIG